MAGCSNARCSSERRSLRRELDHWRKDLITCVGLESFAEFLMGPDRFKEVMPFNGFEAVECADWEPTSECRLCHARREVVTESLEHHRELIERQRTRLEENSSQDYPGSYVPFKFSSAQEAIRHLASHHASKQQQSSQSALQEDSDNLDSDEDDSPPSPQHDSFNGSGTKRLRNSPCWLKIPRVPFGHQARSKHSRQTYSPSDLSRALHDVRAGRLGTRKASNVYGVPRSTIRNYLNRKNCENMKEPKQAAEKEREGEDLPSKGGNRLRTLLESVGGKAQAVLEREAVLRRALNSHHEPDKGRHKQNYANEIKLPITSSILRSLAVARMQEVQGREKRDHRETQVPKVPKKPVQLKIPKVTQRGRTKAEQNENAETTSQQLKTKLRSTIVSRGAFRMDNHPFDSSLFGRSQSQPVAGNSGNSHHSEASSGDGSNTPRRKRGRYRCYTPDDLETAVSMVTMGLMSISRAQQLYRIPHSTLEYKVKERRTELKEAAERNRLFYYPAYMHESSGGGASAYPSPFFQWAWPRGQYYVQDHTSNSHDKNMSGRQEEDDCVIVEEFHPTGQTSSTM